MIVLQSFVSHNQGNQALTALRTIHVNGYKLSIHYGNFVRLLADANNAPETSLSSDASNCDMSSGVSKPLSCHLDQKLFVADFWLFSITFHVNFHMKDVNFVAVVRLWSPV
jgi:hypothetical protein